MTSVNNPYTLNNQGLFLSEIAEKSLSDGREQYFTPPPHCTKETSKNLRYSEQLPIKETPGEKPPFDSIQPSNIRYQQLHSNTYKIFKR